MEDALSFSFSWRQTGERGIPPSQQEVHLMRQTLNYLFTYVCGRLARSLYMTKWKLAEGAESSNMCV
jgi:hypothetical protein